MRIEVLAGLVLGACVPDRPHEHLDAGPDARHHLRDGDSPLPRSCGEALAAGMTTSGIVTIAPDGSGQLDVYCDMTTAGGGWMLVWVTGFTDYANFSNGSNAITPRPTWTFAQANTPTSTTLPTSPDTLGALDYAQWAKFGSEFLVTS